MHHIHKYPIGCWGIAHEVPETLLNALPLSLHTNKPSIMHYILFYTAYNASSALAASGWKFQNTKTAYNLYIYAGDEGPIGRVVDRHNKLLND